MREGWKIKSLGEIGKVSMCKRILKKQTNALSGIPFYKIGTFGKEPNAYISEEIYNEFKNKYSFPNKGDILLSASGTIGRRVVYDGKPAYFQDSNIVWIDNDETEVLNEYLYAFYGFCDWNPSKGATISRLYNDDLRRIEIPFPNLIEEQKQIVSILNKAFTAIDQAKANIEKNIENAKELFGSKKSEYFERLALENELSPITETCEKIFAGGDKPKPNFSKVETDEFKIPVVSNGEKNDGLFGFTNIAKVLKPAITVSARGTIGYTSYRDYPFVPIVRLIVLIPKTDLIDIEFLMYAIKNLDILRTGSSIPQLTVPMIKGYSIPLPSKEKQKEIVQGLNQLEIQLEEYESVLAKKLIELSDLKKSILQKAFAGELTDKPVVV